VSPVKYEMGSYIPEDDILHSPRREDLKSYKALIWFKNHRKQISGLSDLRWPRYNAYLGQLDHFQNLC
jgi:hypothetical protein